MESAAYLHLNITNMITIWIMIALGITAYGVVKSVAAKNKAA